MKHFHSKPPLGEDDVKYLLVENGDQFTIRFGESDKNYGDAPLAQGIKLWLNRCKLLINDAPDEVGRVIIWNTDELRSSRVVGGHFHCYANDQAGLTVVETHGENANLGLFNVWTSDYQRCYELSGNSSIAESASNGCKHYTARHGWSDGTRPTMIFEIERTRFS